MRVFFICCLLAVSSALAAKRPNVLLLCVDDLRPELACYGAAYVQSPHIDALASSGRMFLNHYVQAPTCGASRYALLTGNYGPRGNEALFERAKRLDSATPSLPAVFRKNGYTTVSIGKVSHHPGGRGGSDWDDNLILEMPDSWDRHLMPSGAWQHPRGAMHGLAHGEIRKRATDMAVFQSEAGDDTIYPDGLITAAAIEELQQLAAASDGKPFFLAIGWLKPHLPFGAPAKYMEPYADVKLPAVPRPDKPAGTTTWHPSGEFMKYNRWGKDPRRDASFAEQVRKHYAACVTYADAQVGIVMEKLRQLGLDDNTIVVLWGDHGWHLGEHSIWGKHSLFEESLRSPLIIRAPGTGHPGQPSKTVVETIDVFPSLCDLAAIDTPTGIDGNSLKAHIAAPQNDGGMAVSYAPRADTLRTPTHRLIVHRGKSQAVELYDHTGSDGECTNIAADHPEMVAGLRKQLDALLGE